jgi:hypothetical protein
MGDAKVRLLAEEILALSDGERDELAREVLPLLLSTRPGLQGIDEALRLLPDEDLDTLVERARSRGRDLPEATVAAVIRDALRATRAQSRS